MLNQEQQEILARSGIDLSSLDEETLSGIASRSIDVERIGDEPLVEFIQAANALYRGGRPIVSDADYDFVFIAELRRRHPHHPFLQAVEPEAAFSGKTVDLPARMLSTDKAYSRGEIDRWLARLEKAASEIGLDPATLILRVTPKLDGFAAYDDGTRLYTRGDGRRGTDVSRVFERGLAVGGDGRRGHGAGEIVVNRDYFERHLAAHFENSRNIQASILAEKNMDEHVQRAIDQRAALFFPFNQLPCWEGRVAELSRDFDSIVDRIWNMLEYDVDGVILEATDERLKAHMGATRHHNRWQIAFKANVEKALVRVIRVLPQTSRSGRVNPVVELEPTRLSGATITRATAHHYRMVAEKGIGQGTVIELVRSGLVIPKIESVITPAAPEIPEICPSCGAGLVWEGDYLYCPNTAHCPAQTENTLEHFFRMLGNLDGFGPKAIQKLYEHGIRSIHEIYLLSAERLREMGFGNKVAQNLIDQLARSRTDRIEDWRFLAAFGIFRLGPGNCERLLQHYPLGEIFDLDAEQIKEIEGFADVTAAATVAGLREIREDFFKIHVLGFNLEKTALLAETRAADSPIAGKLVVFTGSMRHGSREDMEREAKRLGAKVGSSVSGKTDLLVTGEKVGAAKIGAAREKGVEILSEDAYLAMLARPDGGQ